MTITRIYRLKRPDLPWGDYGDILAHGMASDMPGTDSLELERTGPFVPPLSQPSGHVVVTDEFLPTFIQSGLTGFDVCPVIKKKITNVDWREWEPYGTQEMKYPAGGEPENYIERRKHSAKLAAEIGDFWWIRFRSGVLANRDNGFKLVGSTWSGADCFVDRERPVYRYVTQKARDWLEQTIPEWVAFEEERVLWNSA